jgi:hypothetical protein
MNAFVVTVDFRRNAAAVPGFGLYELCRSRTAFPPHLPSPAPRRIQQEQRRSRDERDRCKAHLIFEGSNIRR